MQNLANAYLTLNLSSAQKSELVLCLSSPSGQAVSFPITEALPFCSILSQISIFTVDAGSGFAHDPAPFRAIAYAKGLSVCQRMPLTARVFVRLLFRCLSVQALRVSATLAESCL